MEKLGGPTKHLESETLPIGETWPRRGFQAQPPASSCIYPTSEYNMKNVLIIVEHITKKMKNSRQIKVAADKIFGLTAEEREMFVSSILKTCL